MSTTHAHLAVSGNIINRIDGTRWLAQRDSIGSFKIAGFLMCVQGTISIVVSPIHGIIFIIAGIFLYAVGHFWHKGWLMRKTVEMATLAELVLAQKRETLIRTDSTSRWLRNIGLLCRCISRILSKPKSLLGQPTGLPGHEP